MTPGALCDLYILRQRYDDSLSGIQRNMDKQRTRENRAGLR